MRFNQFSVTVDSTGVQVAGSVPKRRALVLSPPPADTLEPNSASVVADNADSSTTGVKLSYTVPAGRRATVINRSVIINTGTPTVQMRYTTGGVTVVTNSTTANLNNVFSLELGPGDVVDMNVSTAGGGGSTVDLALLIQEFSPSQRVTVSFDGTLVLDRGINLPPGGNPVMFQRSDFGEVLDGPIRAITSSGSTTIGVLEVID